MTSRDDQADRSSLAKVAELHSRGSATSERTSSAAGSCGPHEADVGQLIAEYESALSAALTENDQIRAARAFDLADRLQDRLLRGARRAPDGKLEFGPRSDRP